MYHLIKECNQARWAIKILAQDLCGLEREQQHLVLKQRTAELSLWELERLEILELEKIALMMLLETQWRIVLANNIKSNKLQII